MYITIWFTASPKGLETNKMAINIMVKQKMLGK